MLQGPLRGHREVYKDHLEVVPPLALEQSQRLDHPIPFRQLVL